MFDFELKESKGKKRRRNCELKQPLPIPIATLTDVKASDSIWRFYHGKLLDSNQDGGAKINGNEIVMIVQDPQEAKYIYELGFFGLFGNTREKRSKISKKGKKMNE